MTSRGRGGSRLAHARQRKVGGGWVIALLERKHSKAAAVALANKTARIAWAARQEVYTPPRLES